MSLKIVSVKDAGDITNERVVMAVSEAGVDIGFHILFACPADEPGTVESTVKFAYWFEDKKARVGDLIVLYSKVGEEKEKHRTKTTKAHFFYWGLPKAIWGDGKLLPVLIHSDGWDIFDLGGSDREPSES